MNLEHYRFREFRKGDFPEIQKLWIDCNMGGEERGDTEETILNCTLAGGKLIVVQDCINNEIVGTSWLTNDGRRILLHHFCIRKDHRKKGLGTKLGKESLAFIKEKGLQVKLEVHKKNLEAKSLYEKLGFFAFKDYDIYMIRDVDSIPSGD